MTATITSYPESGDAPVMEGGERATSDAKATASMVRKRWDEGSREVAMCRKDYWINLAFYLGQQWLYWNDSRNMVDLLPRSWSPLGPDREHRVFNRIRPNLNIVMGRLMRVPLAFEVPPTDGADDYVLGARKAEKILEAYHRDQDWEAVRHDELVDAFYGGTSAVMVEWDGTRGTELQYDHAADQVVSTGDCYLRALNANEFVLEPFTKPLEARWAVIGITVPVEVAQAQYKLKKKPQPDAAVGRTPMHMNMLEAIGRSSDRDQCLVLTMYERPNPLCRKGRYCVVIGQEVVHEGPWPFPFQNLNVHPFRQARIPGKWYGNTLLNDAVKLQFAYNFSRSVLQQHLTALGNLRIIAPRGAFNEDDFTTEVGDILWYQPDNAGGKPEFMVPPNLARWVSAEPENIRAELDEIMHVHDISRGQGFDRASGQALALLSEKDETPLGIMAHEQSAGWGRIGTQVLKLLEAKGGSSRSVSIPLTKTVAERVSWTGKELRGQTTTQVPLDSVMAKPAAAREAFWRDLWDRKIVTDPRQYARGVGLPPENFEELLDPDSAKAHKENYRMMQGLVEIPEDFDDHTIHIAEHNRFRKSDSYRFADQAARDIIDKHLKYHEMVLHEEFGQQTARAMENPTLARLPRADDPVGSMRAMTGEEQQKLAMMGGGPGGGGMPQGGQMPGAPSETSIDLPPGGVTPALASGVMDGGV